MKRFWSLRHQVTMKRLILLLLLTTSLAASPISDRYAALGGATGTLGTKTSEETNGADGGKFQHFQNGSIFWHPETGARVVRGRIRTRYSALGSEKSFLGYPVTDELNLIDGGGRISRFKGGALFVRPRMLEVIEVKSTNLAVDLPYPVGEVWRVGQTNAIVDSGPNADSHIGQYAHCWDMNFHGGSSEGKPFTASATSRIVFVEQKLSGSNNAGNVVVQHFGEGRYGSYLHIGQNSYSKQFATGPGVLFLPQEVGWAGRPVPKRGTPLGEVSNTGTGSPHMHFCVTTSPDRGAFAPFESVPVSFRNYSVSTDEGKTWKFVKVGVPRSGQLVRREKVIENPNVRQPGAPFVTGPSLISRGTVRGEITAGDGKPTGPGKLHVTILSAWGEPLKTTTIDVPATNLAGPWKFEFTGVPAYKRLRVQVEYKGPWNQDFFRVGATGAEFDLGPMMLVSQTVALKTTKI